MNTVNPEILKWLEEDHDRKWNQSAMHETRFGSNLREALYIENDQVVYWEDFLNKEIFTQHEIPKTKDELFKIFTKSPIKKKPKAGSSETKSLSDDFGNLLITRNNGTRVLISLRLVADKRLRRIGTINLAQKTIDMDRKRNIHLFKKTNSYGFNHNLLNRTKLFDKVRLRDETKEWLIPVNHILENGHFLNFKNQGGFELQIFLPLDKMEQFSRKAKI